MYSNISDGKYIYDCCKPNEIKYRIKCVHINIINMCLQVRNEKINDIKIIKVNIFDKVLLAESKVLKDK